MILLAESEGPDQTARMRSLIWALAVRIWPKTGFCMVQHIYDSGQAFPTRLHVRIADSDQPGHSCSLVSLLCLPECLASLTIHRITCKDSN